MKEFLSLQTKIDQILAAVATNQPQNTDYAEHMIIMVEMGIRELDNSITADHKEFISTTERLIKEVTALKDEFKLTLQKQETHSKQLVEETHNAYESSGTVLQSTINGLRWSLTTNLSVNEILHLTKEIYQLLFNKDIPNNLQICEQMKSQFNETFSKINGLKKWFEDQQEVASSKEEVKVLLEFIKTKIPHYQKLLRFINNTLSHKFNHLLPKNTTNH